ncbi:hypothetical protein BH24CHL6_BH24CHL6_09540 [soil metagenome]
MGGSRDPRTAMPIQTRFVANSALSTVRDEDEQSERARAVWSVVGALALAGVGILALAAAWAMGAPFALLLGLGQLIVTGAVVLVTLKRATRGSGVHLAGIVLAAVSLFVAIVAPTVVLAEWALVGMLLGLVAVFGLVLGRR